MDPDQPPGLRSDEAARRRRVSGWNEPPHARQLAAAFEFVRFFASPLVVILLLAGVISGILGDWLGAGLIVGIVVVSAALDFAQTRHSQKAAERLRAQVAPTARVKRDGAWVDLPRRELVPGDLLFLRAGDLVPADAQLVRAEGLHLQQAALTGESFPVEKSAGVSSGGADPNDPHRVFLGTSVVSGSALAEVLAVGGATAFGAVVQRLAARPPETQFERGMRDLSLLITRAVLFLVVFVFLVSALLHRGALESLLFAVALAVGLTPEFLPMITTVTLSGGAVRMARRKVIVKRLEAIENLGGMDILCSDKTGTLTQEEMDVAAAMDPRGAPSPRALSLARLNSRFETGIQGVLDAAILAEPRLPDEPEFPDAVRVGEIPFDFERRRLSVSVALPEGTLLVTKGAPESLFALCARWEIEGCEAPFDDAARVSALETYRRLSGEGLRVLAVAFRPIAADSGPLRVADEAQMTLAGFLTFANRPVPDVVATLQRLHEDGIRVKILTGDNELVTAHLCRTVGLEVPRIVRGDEIAAMDDVALGHVAETVDVFARVSPAQKSRILMALKARGHVVGFLGDGINDAPSLHAADVGISVATAVDVARDAASIILMERSLAVLHEGVREGRRAFGNVLKYLLMNLSSNFGNMVSMAGAPLLLPFLPMRPTQILLNNFLYDLSQITIPTDEVDEDLLRRPRRWDMRLIRDFMLLAGPISSLYDFLTFFALRSLFRASETLFHTGWFIESLATQVLVIFVIRTARVPWRSRPSAALTATMLAVVAVSLALPFTPLGRAFGFVPLPPAFFGFLVVVVAAYLAMVEAIKRRLLRQLLQAG